MVRYQNKEVLYGLYDDETELLTAVKEANAQHLDIMDVFTPFPVHGLDPLLGLSESRLHIAGFFYGLIGTCTAFGFMTWVFTRDWPVIFGGKPYFSVPAFIPITFELTVLFACIGMTVTYYTVSGMGFGVRNVVLDERITDDKFCIAFQVDHSSPEQLTQYNDFLRSTGANDINTKRI